MGEIYKFCGSREYTICIIDLGDGRPMLVLKLAFYGSVNYIVF